MPLFPPDSDLDLFPEEERERDLLWLGLSNGGTRTEKARSTAEMSANLKPSLSFISDP